MQTATTATAIQANALVDRYIAIWNERDSTRRRALIAQTWADNATFLDPLMKGDGHSGIDAMIQAVQERFVGHHFRSLNNVDAYGNYMRFSWELAPEDGPGIAGGTDFATIAADGRLQTVIGFLDFVPTPNA